MDEHIYKAKTAEIKQPKPLKPYVGDDGIYIPCATNSTLYQMLISKELFVKAYNKWIKEETSGSNYIGCCGDDDVDCWCE